MTDDGRTLLALTELLDELPVKAPDRLLAAVLDGVRAAPQRGRWPSVGAAVGLRSDSFTPRLAAGALLVAVLVVVASIAVGMLLPDRAAPGVGTTPTATPVASPIWTATGAMSEARTWHTATLLHDGSVLVAGGANGSSDAMASAELFDPVAGTWSPTGSMTVVRDDHTATLLPNGKVLVAGGVGSGGNEPFASAELYDPEAGTWTATGSIAEARNVPTATLLLDGKVLLTGGFGVSSAEIYDPGTGAWTSTGRMSTDRGYHTATLLLDGKVLVAGGSGGGGATAEVYDPNAGSWTPTAAMTGRRSGHAAVRLPDGKVLVVGGSGTDGSFPPLASAELYDPVSASWTAIESMGWPRVYPTATLLPDGDVLVTGGFSGGDNNQVDQLAPAELFDPTQLTWTATTAMSQVRVYHTASLLPDGRVLVVGGRNKPVLGSASATSELYER